jgi:hypothetical protein
LAFAQVGVLGVLTPAVRLFTERGSTVIVARLLHVLLIQVVRVWADDQVLGEVAPTVHLDSTADGTA